MLIAAALLLVAVVAADALRGHGHRSAPPTSRPVPAEIVSEVPATREARSEMSDPFAVPVPGCPRHTFREGRLPARVRGYGRSAEGPVRCRGAG